MKKYLYLFILFILTQITFGQENQNKFTFDFVNLNRKEIITKIESSTNFRFYFDENWFENENTQITKSYKEVTVNSIVSDLLLSTDFNFLILKNKIILTKNIVIYDTLPDNFFKNDTKDSVSKNDVLNLEKPIFQQQNESILSLKKLTSSFTTDSFNVIFK